MYHRFCPSSNTDPHKVDAETFEWQLAQLSHTWKLVTLTEYVHSQRLAKPPPPYLVVLTIDDGYHDFYRIAYPYLRRYHYPATLFPTIAFSDGEWMWWDRISYVLQRTQIKSLAWTYADRTFNLNLLTEGALKKTCSELLHYCSQCDNISRNDFITQLERELIVTPPTSPPFGYAPATWDQIKEMSTNGIEIGSHTITHPILARIPSSQIKHELHLSRQILQDRLGTAIRTFCYPDGMPFSLHPSLPNEVRDAGYIGAVVAYADPTRSLDPFLIPRMNVTRDRVDFLWKLSGMEFIGLAIHNCMKSIRRRISARSQAVLWACSSLLLGRRNNG